MWLTGLPVPLVALSRTLVRVWILVVRELLLGIQEKLLDVVGVLVLRLLLAVVVLRGHQIRILFYSSSIHRAVIYRVAIVVSAITVTEGRLVAPNDIHIELVLRRHIGCVVLVGMRLLSAIVGVVDRWSRDSIRGSDAVFKIYYGGPSFNIIIIASATKGNISTFLH